MRLLRILVALAALTLAVIAHATELPARVPVIALVGDSTVTDAKGWGAAFANALGDRAEVHNFAIGGRSAKSYTDERRLSAALAVKPDYGFLQFGHNGQPGKGAHRETDPQGDYRGYLRAFVEEIRSAGAKAVIVSSVTRRIFDADGKIQSTLEPWAAGARAVAEQLGVPFVDLHARSIAYHDRIGPWRSKLFDMAPDDQTHLNSLGASVVSGMIFDALDDVGHPLAALRPMAVRVSSDVISADDGVPVVRTIAEAIGLAPTADNGAFRVQLGQARYAEKLIVDKPQVHLIGVDRDETIVFWNDSGDSPGLDGHPVGTWGSYSVKVVAPDFAARDLTFENAFDYASNRALPDDDPTKVRNAQGVALMLADGSDRAHFDNVAFLGNQDTLFVNAGRSYFDDVRIVGHVDFIFGAGQAVFEDATIEALNRPGKNPTAYVTAPSTHISQPFGFLFINCRILRHDDAVPAGSVKLGRPWHPGSDPEVNGSAVFRNCYMDDSVAEDGYARISGTIDGRRSWFDLEPDSRFFEYRSHGPGALQGPRRPQLPEAAARYYTRQGVLADWNPGENDW